MISFVQKGNFSKTDSFLEKMLNVAKIGELDKYGREGVAALEAATPVDSGITAKSWSYKIERNPGQTSIVWCNSCIENGYNVAVLIQYGHGTKNGGFVQGRDYINPAIQPIFDKIAEKVWKEVTGK